MAAAGLPRSFTIDHTAAPPPPDTTAPTTSITSPAGGATVSGTTSVTANASDNVGVTKVEFYLDGVLQSSDTTAPYAWSWNTTTAANGSHTLSSTAYNVAGNSGTSAGVTVSVSNAAADTTPPSAPANLVAPGAKRKVSLTWSASTDNVGVSAYRVLRATSAAGPFAQIATTTTTSYTNSGLTARNVLLPGHGAGCGRKCLRTFEHRECSRSLIDAPVCGRVH